MRIKHIEKSVQRIVIFIFITFLFIVVQLYPIPYMLYPAYAAGASLSLSPSSGTFNKGCSFALEIKLDTNGAQTDGTDAILIYDPARFSATTVRSGTIYADYPGNSVDTQTGKITVSGLASVSAPFIGQGTLATIDFNVLSTAPEGTTQIVFDFDTSDRTKTTDSNVVERGTVVDILNQVGNGSFTIGTGSCNTVTTPKPTVIPGGGPDTPLVTTIPVKPKPPLPEAADFGTTFILGAGGALLVILGILGLALL